MHNLQNKNEPNGSLLGLNPVALEGCGQALIIGYIILNIT